MPQSIFVQVGQCGNQIGFNFWENAVKEYELHQKKIKNCDIHHFFKCQDDFFKARAILIDMEPGVISMGRKGYQKKLFSEDQILTDQSGSANNWAVGNLVYGEMYMDKVIDMFQKEIEQCDNLQSLLFTFSLGGGTGSGLGTATLELLSTYFPKIERIVFAVFPSLIDDVVTSPYNALLANSKLIEYASVVIPFDNERLNEICSRISKNHYLHSNSTHINQQAIGFPSKSFMSKKQQYRPFDLMNSLVVSTILDVTSSARFHGSSNVDMIELLTNLIPQKRIHYCVPALAPLLSQDDSKTDQLFRDLFAGTNSLLSCSLKKGLIATYILGRGAVSSFEMQENILESNHYFKFVQPFGAQWKIGQCDIPPLNRQRSLFQLGNSTAITKTFKNMRDKFQKMYEVKANFHHYTEVNSNVGEIFNDAVENITRLIDEYRSLERHQYEIPRLNVI